MVMLHALAHPLMRVKMLPTLLSKTLTLRDGTQVLIRPITPDDKMRLQEGLTRLSEASRYRRFMGAMSTFSPDQLRHLTEVDHKDHVAWIALDLASEGQPGLGVARYVRLKGEPEVAEAAVAVIDSHHGKGLGTFLLGFLALSGRENGIRAFRAYVLAENRPVLQILRDLGARTSREGGGLLRVDVPIPDDPAKLPDTPTGRVLKAVANELLTPVGLREPGAETDGQVE